MITIKEIAKICDCSVATVNRALYDRPDVSEKTKDKIKKIAQEYGYRPDHMARSLATGRTNIIGLIVLDIQNPFFGQIIDILNHDLLKKGYSLHLGIMDGTPESEYRVLEQFASLRVDGIIHFPLNVGEKYVTYLKQLCIPIIHLCNWLDDDFPFVGAEEEDAMIRAVDYISKSAYQELIYVSPPLRYKGGRNLYTLEERLKGVEKSAREMKLHILKDKNYINETVDIITSSQKRSCVFCSSDIFALDIMTELRKKGLIPPKDYGIMGFDNISILRHISPKLTTMAYPMEELAHNALDNLMKLINGEAIEKCILKIKLVPGETI